MSAVLSVVLGVVGVVVVVLAGAVMVICALRTLRLIFELALYRWFAVEVDMFGSANQETLESMVSIPVIGLAAGIACGLGVNFASSADNPSEVVVGIGLAALTSLLAAQFVMLRTVKALGRPNRAMKLRRRLASLENALDNPAIPPATLLRHRFEVLRTHDAAVRLLLRGKGCSFGSWRKQALAAKGVRKTVVLLGAVVSLFPLLLLYIALSTPGVDWEEITWTTSLVATGIAVTLLWPVLEWKVYCRRCITVGLSLVMRTDRIDRRLERIEQELMRDLGRLPVRASASEVLLDLAWAAAVKIRSLTKSMSGYRPRIARQGQRSRTGS